MYFFFCKNISLWLCFFSFFKLYWFKSSSFAPFFFMILVILVFIYLFQTNERRSFENQCYSTSLVVLRAFLLTKSIYNGKYITKISSPNTHTITIQHIRVITFHPISMTHITILSSSLPLPLLSFASPDICHAVISEPQPYLVVTRPWRRRSAKIE